MELCKFILLFLFLVIGTTSVDAMIKSTPTLTSLFYSTDQVQFCYAMEECIIPIVQNYSSSSVNGTCPENQTVQNITNTLECVPLILGPQGLKGDKGDKGNTGDTGGPGSPGVNGSTPSNISCANITSTAADLCIITQVVDTDTWNNTIDMIKAVNGSALNLSTSFEYPEADLIFTANKTSIWDAIASLFSSNISIWTSLNVLVISNTSQATDNTTQAALINTRVLPLTCSGNQVVQTTTTSGGTCLTVALTDTDTWNTTEQMRAAITGTENLTKSYCGNITGATSNLCTLVDTDTNTWNTSTQMFNAANNSALYLANAYGYVWSSLTTWPAKCSAGQAVVNLSTGACSAFATSDTDTWNTTTQMFNAANNSALSLLNAYAYPWASLTTWPVKCAAGQAVINLSTGACGTFATADTDTWNTTWDMQLACSGNISALKTDNTTQAGLINSKITIGTQIPANNISLGTFPGSSYTISNLTVNGNLTLPGQGCKGNCVTGTIAWNTTRLCVCTSANTWKTVVIA